MEHNDQSVQQHSINVTSLLSEAEKYLYSFPIGYKFDPTDVELISAYLLPKINGEPLPVNLMHEVNIYQYSPDRLGEKYPSQGNKCWYFFTSRDKKYPNGKRPNRRAGDGYWKATGADKVINQDGVKVGFRKALVFYKGRPPRGVKTLWIMHEFRVSGPSPVKKRKFTSIGEGTSMRLDDCVLSRIYKKKTDGSNKKKTRAQQVVQDESHGAEPEEASPEPETSSFESAPSSNKAGDKPNMYSTDNNYVNTGSNFQSASNINHNYVNTSNNFQSASNINQQYVPFEPWMDNTGFPDHNSVDTTSFVGFQDNQCSSIGDQNFYFSEGSKGSYYDIGDPCRFLLEEPTPTIADLMGMVSHEAAAHESFSHHDMKKTTMPPPPRH